MSNGYHDRVNIHTSNSASSNGSSGQDSGIGGMNDSKPHDENKSGKALSTSKNSLGKQSISTIGPCSIGEESINGSSSSGSTFAGVPSKQMTHPIHDVPQNMPYNKKVPPPTKAKPALPPGTTIMSLTNKADQDIVQSQSILQQAVKVLPDVAIQSMANVSSPGTQETSFVHQANELKRLFDGHTNRNWLGHQRNISQHTNSPHFPRSDAKSNESGNRGPLPSIPDRLSKVYGSLPGRGRYSRHIVASDDNTCTLTRYRRHSGSGY